MNLLLDTCTFLWLAADARELSPLARTSCRDPGNKVYLSSLSVWEIVIKNRLGRLPLPENPTSYVISRRNWLQVEALAFDEDDALSDEQLPAYHRDPFDRGLISQAISKDMTLVTPDSMIARYPVSVLWQ